MESSELTIEERVKYALFESLSTPSGRLVLLWATNLLSNYDDEFPVDPHRIAFNEGRRCAGRETLTSVKTTHPQLYAQMMRELLDIQLMESLQEDT